MSWLRWTTRIGSGIASPFTWLGWPFPFQHSNVQPERLADARAEVQPLDEHVGHLAPGREVVERPLADRLLDHPDDLVVFLRGSGRRSRTPRCRA